MSERIEIVIYVVCDSYDITAEQLTSASHAWRIADARAVICFILRERQHMTLSAIGALLHRHHSTVLCAARKVRTWLDNPKIFPRENETFDNIVERINTLTDKTRTATVCSHKHLPKR